MKVKKKNKVNLKKHNKNIKIYLLLLNSYCYLVIVNKKKTIHIQIGCCIIFFPRKKTTRNSISFHNLEK